MKEFTNHKDADTSSIYVSKKKAVVDAIPSLVWTCRPDGYIDFLNQRWIDYTGFSLNEIEGWAWTNTDLVYAEDLARLIETWLAIFASGEAGEAEARMKRFDGEYRWFLFRIVPVPDESDSIVQWYGTTTDIEDRKWVETLLSGENRILEMIASGCSLAEILDALCRLVEHTASDYLCAITLMNPSSTRKLHVAGPSLPNSYNEAVLARPVNTESGPCARAACLKQQVIVADVANDKRFDAYEWTTGALAHGLRSCWSTPILSADENVLGSFAIYSHQPRSPSQQQQKIIEQITHLASIAIERTRTEAALRESEERIRRNEQEFRQIVEAIPQLILVLSPDGSFLYANKLLLQYTGLCPEDLQSTDFRARVVHSEDLDRLKNDRKEGLLRGLPFEMEQRILRKDGVYRWFLTRLNPLKDQEGSIVRWYGTWTDIDDRKLAEDRLEKENIALREEIDKTSMFEEIVGTSPGLQTVLASIAKVAPTDSTVLITGETGTGKELIARAIHKRSHRASRAFISVNCAAIPPSLIASELFGHEKGAFTGALQRRLGRFELAEGGTIFLDEIGELPNETQLALLRVLQEREFERVGGSQPLRVDVRVVAATNRDLKASIIAGSFRSDLFYRLNVFPVEIPPLRERREDILLLVEYFIDRYASMAGKKIRGINKKTLELLQSYPWPGNIRELQNVIERSIIVSETENLSVDERWVSTDTHSAPLPIPELSIQRSTQEKEMIETALTETKGKVSGHSGAAAKLGIPASTLESKIRALKINKHRFKTL